MRSNHSIKILGTLLLLIIMYVFACAPAMQKPVAQAQKPEKYRTVLCKSIEKKGKSAYPVQITDRFIKGDGRKVYVFTDWFDLIPDAKYLIRWEYYDPNGQIITSRSHRLIPNRSHWKTWHSIFLYHKYNRLSGLWSVKIYANQDFISEEKFLIADNDAELAKLAVRLDTQEYVRQEKDQKIASIEKPKIIIKGEKVKIGIIEFQSLNEEAKKDNLGKIVSEMLTTSFVNSESFKIIEREQLQKVVQEFQLSQSGIIDTSYAKQIGKIAGADAIVTGSVTKIGGDLRLDARIIDVESGIILTAEKSVGKVDLKSIGMMTDQIVANLVNKFYENRK
jgi:TolB-like protein